MLPNSTFYLYIIELYDKKANLKEVKHAFKKLFKAKYSDTVIIFLAGHGKVIKDKYYFLTTDTEPSLSGVSKTALSEDFLKESVSMIKSQRMFLIIDSCESGSAIKHLGQVIATRGINETLVINELKKTIGSFFIAAAQSDQVALEGIDGHGLLTFSLLRGLYG